MRYAAITNSTVTNVIEADGEYAAQHGLTLVEGMSPEPGIGWTLNGQTFQAPTRDPALDVAAVLQSRAQQAVQVNINFLAVANPTNAQLVAQVKRLTQECTALIRLLLQELDSTNGS